MFNKQSIKYLNSIDYNPIAFPYNEVNLLDLLWRGKKSFKNIGPISDFFIETTGEEPETTKDRIVPNISGKLTANFDFKLGVTAAGNLLSAIGAKGASIEPGYSRARTFTFEYRNILMDSVKPSRVTKYLDAAVPDINSGLIKDIDEKNETYIVCGILKSNSFSTISTDEKGYSLDINVTEIQSLMSGYANIDVKKTEDFAISFEGDTYFDFAVSVIRTWISVEDKKFIIEMIDKPPLGNVKSIQLGNIIQPGELIEVD